MKFTGVLVRPLADQADRDGTLIDPAGVAFETYRYPVFAEHDYGKPLGYAVVSRDEDGSLTAAGEIVYAEPEAVRGLRLAAGVAFDASDIFAGVSGQISRVVARCRLNAVGLTANHADPGQPAIQEIEG